MSKIETIYSKVNLTNKAHWKSHLLNASMKFPATLYFTFYDKVGNQEKAVKARFWKAFQVTQRKRRMCHKTS